MTNEEINELEATARFSGFSRDRGVQVVLRLIAELRFLRKTPAIPPARERTPGC